MEHSNELGGFNFQLNFDESNGEAEASFKEVSGISVTMETNKIVEGGDNSFQHRVPGRTTYENLVLKRGLVSKESPLFIWCNETLSGDFSKPITPKNITVTLFDASAAPIMIWQFKNAYPVKWSILGTGTMDNEEVIETLEFTYTYFERANVSISFQ